MRIAVATLGCKVNQYESSALADSLARNYTIVPFNEEADLYLVNTCAVTAEAEHKSRQLIYRARRASPNARIVAAGCYGELSAGGLADSGADLVVGNSGKSRLGMIIHEMFPDDMAASSGKQRPRRARAVVKIQDGCDQYCSYCIIPYLRGPLSSRAVGEIIDEIILLTASGVKEVVLTGIHMGKYGAEANNEDLAALVRKIMAETDIEHIRLSSIEPVEVTDDLINLMSESKRIAPHLHIPLQSGSDRILKAMNRPYNARQFTALIEKARQSLSADLAVTTDILVGFPGETPADFADSINLATASKFSKIHIFKYSDRPPAAASKLPRKIAAEVKKDRAAALRHVGNNMAAEFRRSQIGRQMSVVIETFKDGSSLGMSGNYLKVAISGKKPKGEMVRVTAVSECDGRLIAEFSPDLRRGVSQI